MATVVASLVVLALWPSSSAARSGPGGLGLIHHPGQPQDHNNVYLQLRGNGGSTTYWAWTSGDDVEGEQTYQYAVNEFAPRNTNPYMKFHVTFDQSGSDPSCQFYVHLY